MKKLVLSLCVLGILGIAIAAIAAMTARDFTGCLERYGCTYDIVWDGWKGFLTLGPDGTGTLEQTTGTRGRYSVRHQILCDPQDTIEGSRGPGYQRSSTLKHRIVFWVDFKNTPRNHNDDQRFDGYMMTQTKDSIAGITWWNRIPFGFYATNKTAPLI
ncbi:MAG: hypothetical protein AB1414_05430 [bacterium]